MYKFDSERVLAVKMWFLVSILPGIFLLICTPGAALLYDWNLDEIVRMLVITGLLTFVWSIMSIPMVIASFKISNYVDNLEAN